MMEGEALNFLFSRKLIPKECNLAAAQKEELTIMPPVGKWLSCHKAFTLRKGYWDLMKNTSHQL